MRRCDENELFPFWICFSDEATFQLSGEVNRHNLLLFGSRVVTTLNYFSFNASISDGLVFNTLFFKKARKQLSRGFKSSELGGHSVEPLLSIQRPGKMLYNRAHNQTEMTRGYILFKQDMKCMYVPAIFRIGGIIWLFNKLMYSSAVKLSSMKKDPTTWLLKILTHTLIFYSCFVWLSLTQW